MQAVNVILGSRGRLGRGIMATLPGALALDHQSYCHWHESGSLAQIRDTLIGLKGEHSTLNVIVASGITNPQAPVNKINEVNYILPRNLSEVAATIQGCRIVTFGTVMEMLGEAQNPYIQSKRRLADFVQNSFYPEKNLHIRLHTLFGVGQPHSFMFLGQIVSALKEGRPFEMTAGLQLREYHHVEDDSKALNTMLRAGLTGVVDLSHGEVVTLRQLAEHIFESLGKSQLLKVSKDLPSFKENYDKVYGKHEIFSDFEFRKTLPAISTYVKNCLSQGD